jgi:phage tail-like protein
MPLIGTPVKKFKYVLEIEGIPIASIQEITPPEVEIEASIHSEGSYDAKTPGRITTGDMTLSKVMDSLDVADRWAWFWLTQAQSYDGLQISLGYKRNGRLILNDDNGLPVRVWFIGGAWVRKVSLGDLSSTTSDNVMEEVTLSVDIFKEEILAI